MKTKYFFLAALAGMTLASCSDDVFVGDNSPNVIEETTIDNGIRFGSGFRAVTRADKYDKDAADLLGSKFIVTGVKGDGAWDADQTDVFKSYSVEWAQNTAGTTESNTSDWEYVGKTNNFGLTGAQAIKYWDFSQAAYNFAAYSLGVGDVTTSTYATGSAISIANEATANAGAYTLEGNRAQLTACYITDMKTVAKGGTGTYPEGYNYGKEVTLEFRSLATKVRMAIYETIPGYSVKDVKFYTTDQTPATMYDGTTNPATTHYATSTTATLFGTNVFREAGTYTVKFPTIGSDNSGEDDYNKAHVTFTAAATDATSSTQEFGPLNYTGAEDHEESGSYLQRSSYSPSFAGSGTYYQVMLPNEEGAVLEMCVDYTLVATDGGDENITVHGAKAFVPAVYTKWLPNYAYTYIFKISDNSNGWTNPNGSDPAGLFPITFDAVVLDSEITGTQTTITTVATPSITTYQKGHVYDQSNSYEAGEIYVQVMNDGTLIGNLDETDPFQKSYIYTLSADKTEADVMDALNIRASVNGTTGAITGRNGLVLTPGTLTFNETDLNNKLYIPGEDGNNIEVDKGEAAKFTAAASTYYAFVYQVSAGTASNVITTVYGTQPDDWSQGGYYTALNAERTDVAGDAAVGPFSDTTKYYKKYIDLNNVYAVKVIKVGTVPTP